ncbi:MAG: HTH-type transcriptional regulator DmlR [Paracidovorax wautersii]|uniref:HTH-type transcriptional regulator DmlR n=1 Tax=Paracidovorax wautersii TaxID=1177982 RepID=A0A7V8FM65_9BURK|nr:MAG: HTH-type transcriptional regulator DmlR [Paracidovorax wautersii]
MQKANNSGEFDVAHFANLKRLAYFAAVVETGSFTAAADHLNVTKAVVSQQVARLEREFRTTLLTRTTRKVMPTQAGNNFYQRCALILKEAGDAFEELGETAAEPSGTLHLTAPLDYGITAVVPCITEFTRRFPGCKVDAVLSDQALDLAAGQAELAIRVGWLTDLNVQARQIGRFRQLLVAAPLLRQQITGLEAPKDITARPFVANKALRDPTHWHFSRPEREPQHVTVHPAISMNTTLAVLEAVRQGAGLSVLPDYVVAQDLAAGRLIQVLPLWALPSGGIHLVFPPARFRPAKVRAFADLIAERENQRHGQAPPG